MRGLRIFTWPGLVVLAGLLSEARAKVLWEIFPVVIDEKVVDTGKPAVIEFQQIKAQVPFDNLRYPFLDTEMNLVFIADDPNRTREAGKKSPHHGIFRSPAAGGNLESLVVAKMTLTPDGLSRFGYIRGLQGWKTDFVFHSALVKVDKSGSGEDGIFEWAGGKLLSVVETGKPVRDLQDRKFTSVEYGSISEKFIFFGGELEDRERGLFLLDRRTRKLRQILSGRDRMPGREESSFAYFAAQNWVQENALAFRADSVERPNNSGTRGIYAYWPEDDPEFARVEAKKLTVIADPMTKIPDGGGIQFAHMQSAPCADHLVAFTGGGGNLLGVYVWTREGLRCVLDNQTVLQGLADEPFVIFDKWLTLVGRRVLFLARTDGDYAALFAYDVDRDQLSMIVDNRQIIGGKKVDYFEISSHPAAADSFAFMAKFVDGTSGIYLATMPMRVFGRQGKEAEEFGR